MSDIDHSTAEKERGLLEQDYATPCPKCGGVVFEWWDSDTCRDCEDTNDETSTEQATLMADGGTEREGAEYGRCILCDTPYETYTKSDGPDSWLIGKTCPNEECEHE